MDTFAYNLDENVFTACNQAAKAVTLIDTSSATGFILSNPWGSGKKLLLDSVRFAHTTVPTATSIVFLAMSVAPSMVAITGGTAITVYGADGSGASTRSNARAYSIATTPNLPVYMMPIGYAPTTPATTGGLTWRVQLDGSVILVPGSYVQISYLGEAPTGMADMTWVEVNE